MSDLQKRLYAMELEPPPEVWEKLSDNLDEINADNIVARKLEEVELNPGMDAWKKIARTLGGESVSIPSENGRIINFRRVAAAAIVIGLLLGTYFLFFNTSRENNIAISDVPSKNPVIPSPQENIVTSVEQPVITKKEPSLVVIPEKDPTPDIYAGNLNRIPAPRPRKDATSIASNAKATHVSTRLEEKTFNQSLDDLSFVASNTGYMTMVSADGRLVKISEKYSAIAPYLQDKTEYPEYLADILSGEGAYWKDKFREWRQKLAQTSVTPSHDNFFDIVSLLKTIQD